MKKGKEELFPVYSEMINSFFSRRGKRKEYQHKLLQINKTDSRKAMAAKDDIDNFLELEIDELVAYIIQANSLAGHKAIRLEEWFTPVEIDRGRGWVNIAKPDIKLPLEFEMMEINSSTFIGKIDIETLVRMKDSGLIIYDYNIQREAKLTKDSDGQILSTPTLFHSNILEMQRLLLQGDLISTEIALNIKKDEDNPKIEYYPESNTLRILKGAEIAALDGYHRLVAAASALAKNPELKFNFGLKIVYRTIEEAKEYQYQLNKNTKFSTARMSQLGQFEYSDSVLSHVVENSELKNKVTISGRVQKDLGHITTYNVLLLGLKAFFPIKNKIESKKVQSFLIDFFDHYIGYELVPEGIMSRYHYILLACASAEYEKNTEVTEEMVISVVKKSNKIMQIDEIKKGLIAMGKTGNKHLEKEVMKYV